MLVAQVDIDSLHGAAPAAAIHADRRPHDRPAGAMHAQLLQCKGQPRLVQPVGLRQQQADRRLHGRVQHARMQPPVAAERDGIQREPGQHLPLAEPHPLHPPVAGTIVDADAVEQRIQRRGIEAAQPGPRAQSLEIQRFHGGGREHFCAALAVLCRLAVRLRVDPEVDPRVLQRQLDMQCVVLRRRHIGRQPHDVPELQRAGGQLLRVQ